VQVEREARSQRALTQRHELRSGMNDLDERATDSAPRADTEQRLGGRVQVRDEQLIVEQNDGRGQAAQNVVRIRAAARPSQRCGGNG